MAVPFRVHAADSVIKHTVQSAALLSRSNVTKSEYCCQYYTQQAQIKYGLEVALFLITISIK